MRTLLPRPSRLAASADRRLCFSLIVLLLVAAASTANAQVSIPSLGTPVTENFNTLVSTPDNSLFSTMPTGWFFFETGTSGNTTYRVGTGSGNTGDTYSFGATGNTERALGGLQSGTTIPTVGGQFQNNTGSTIGSLAIAYTGEQWRVGALGRADRLDFQYSLDATSLSTGTWTDVDALDFTGPDQAGVVGARDGNNALYRTARSATVCLNLSAGATVWIRWMDFNPTGSDDGLGVDDVSVTAAGAMQLAEAHTDVTCFGAADGTIDLTVTGTTGPYTYSWNPGGATTEDLSGLGPGTYTVTVTDANGCTATLAVTITEPTALLLNETHTNVSCNVDNSDANATTGKVRPSTSSDDGTIDLTVSGGTAPYTYDWFPIGETTEDLSNLAAGTYTVTVTDANGCTATLDVTITEPPILTASKARTDVSCFGGSDGAIDITVSGGVPGYTYVWSPGGETTEDLSGLSAGLYEVTITDASGCSITRSAVISEPEALELSETHEDVACNGGATGTIDLSVNGGTEPYGYLWSPGGETTEDLSGLAAGTYSVTVTDAKGCSADLSVTIAETSTLLLSETHVNVVCNGGATGSIDLSVSGGTPGYTYLWSPGGATTQDLSGLAAGTYSVTVTDANGCTATLDVEITESSDLSLTETHTDVGCVGEPGGSIDLSVSGGTPGYTYLWSPGGETTQDLSDLAAGTYEVTVTDANGCSATLSVTIDPAPTYTITATADVGGTISPSGAVVVTCGDDVTFTITPDSMHVILDVTVDGNSQGPQATYTFTDVQADHTIHATFDMIVATFLSVFSANPVDDGIELRWRVTDQDLSERITLERGPSSAGPWTAVTAAARREGDDVLVQDLGLDAGITYYYQLRATQRDGRTVILGGISGTAGERLTAFVLAPVWPNPVQGAAHVDFSVPRESRVRLRVLDIQGREVAVLADATYAPGRYQAMWSGESERGLAVPSGVYFLNLQSVDGNRTQRIVLAR